MEEPDLSFPGDIILESFQIINVWSRCVNLRRLLFDSFMYCYCNYSRYKI